MYYSDFDLCLFFSIQMTVFVYFILPYKRTKWSIIFLFIYSYFNYYLIILIAHLDVLWVINFVYETMISGTIIVVFTKGSFWRNYMTLWICFQLSNILFTVLNIADFILPCTAFVLFVLSIFISVIILKKVFRYKANTSDKIYKVWWMIIMIIGTVFSIIRNTKDQLLNLSYKSFGNLFYIFTIFIIFEIMAYIYNVIELKRVRKESISLKNRIINDYPGYINLLESNKELIMLKGKFEDYIDESHMDLYQKDDFNLKLYGVDELAVTVPLCKRILIDSIIFEFYKTAKENNIVFEGVVQCFDFPKEYDIKIAHVLDSLYRYVFLNENNIQYIEWVSLSIREKGKALLIILEHNYINNEITNNYSKSHGRKKLIYQIRNTIGLYNGTVEFSENRNEYKVSIMLI